MSRLIDQIKKHEGFRSRMYKDTVGVNTIGFGRNMDDVPVSEGVAELMLMEDVAVATDAASTMDYWPELNDVRQDVIVNMVFNLGFTRFAKFKNMRAALLIGDYTLTAKEMLDSKWAKQVGRRAEELAAQMDTGEYAS